MKTIFTAALLGLLVIANQAGAEGEPGRAVLIDLDGAIGAGTAGYITSALAEAAERNAEVIILRMDTPGGLDLSMREIIKAILASPVPVVTWVAPGGARADSAGTYILLASHVAAMAPTTHLGAATPVNMLGGGDQRPPLPGGIPMPGDKPADDETSSEKPSKDDAGSDEPESGDEEPAAETAPQVPGTAMERKVLNDAIAYIRSLAETRGRNVEWAEKAVRDAATLTASEALEQNVIEIIAASMPDLLSQLDGRQVKLDDGEATLATSGIPVDTIEATWRQKLLSAIASPEIAILLMFAGIYGLVFEGWNPGAIVPGVIGAICLLLAAYALNVMPVNYAGLGLILLGVVLIVAEVFVPSFGALGIGGVASMIIGSIMMFDTGVPGFDISRSFVGSIGAVAGLTLLALGHYAVKIMRRHSVAGRELILNDTAVAQEAFEVTGSVWLEGEIWQARSTSPVAEGQNLRVIGIGGLVLDVEPLPHAQPDPHHSPT